jgi:hypothetical protein
LLTNARIMIQSHEHEGRGAGQLEKESTFIQVDAMNRFSTANVSSSRSQVSEYVLPPKAFIQTRVIRLTGYVMIMQAVTHVFSAPRCILWNVGLNSMEMITALAAQKWSSPDHKNSKETLSPSLATTKILQINNITPKRVVAEFRRAQVFCCLALYVLNIASSSGTENVNTDMSSQDWPSSPPLSSEGQMGFC